VNAAEGLRRIQAGVRRGDYTVLRDGGEALVFARARELGLTAAELIRGWAAGESRASATACGMCGGSGRCKACDGTGRTKGGDDDFDDADDRDDDDFDRRRNTDEDDDQDE
jgi:hypothetical protein